METKPAREVRLAIVLYDASALATRVYRPLRIFISVFLSLSHQVDNG